MHYLIVILGSCLLGLAASESLAPAFLETNICTGFPLGSHVHNVNDCSSFFICAHSGPVRAQCALGNFFDSAHGSCALPPVNCFACPSLPVFADLPVEHECLQFVRCFDGYATQHTCSDGLLFDPKLRQCNMKREVECDCPNVDILSRPLFVRDWKKCSKYYLCINGKKLRSECPKDLVFNLENLRCDFKDRVNCNATSNTNAYL